MDHGRSCQGSPMLKIARATNMLNRMRIEALHAPCFNASVLTLLLFLRGRVLKVELCLFALPGKTVRFNKTVLDRLTQRTGDGRFQKKMCGDLKGLTTRGFHVCCAPLTALVYLRGRVDSFLQNHGRRGITNSEIKVLSLCLRLYSMLSPLASTV